MRLGYLFVTFVVTGGWTVLSMRAGQILDIPIGLVSFVGVIVTGKVFQSFGEQKPSIPYYEGRIAQAKRAPADL